MTIAELATLASEVEKRTENLYRHMSVAFAADAAMRDFLLELAEQEAEHAALIERATALARNPGQELEVDTDAFTVFLDTVDDVEDEVRTRDITVPAALEIILHLEHSVAEDFYGAIPAHIGQLPGDFVGVMIESCRIHLEKIEAFRRHCLSQSM